MSVVLLILVGLELTSFRSVPPAAQSSAARVPVTIELPPWVRGGACVIAGRAIEVRTTGERPTIDVPCADPAGVVSCDFDGAEPLDASLPNVCATRQLTVERSRPVSIVAERTTAARIEWLALRADGRFERRASRDMKLDERDPLAVPVAGGRFLRLTPAGASPVTVDAGRLTTEAPWTIPVSSGGEALIGLEQANVLPARFLLRGADERVLPAESRVASFAGLTPGSYIVTPEYTGGVPGEAFRVTVEAGTSTVVALPAADVGAVRMTANETACEATAEIRLSGRVNGLEGKLVKGQSVMILHEGQCDRTIAGLRPGEYAVWLGTGSNVYVRGDAAVHRQQVAEVSLDARAVTLSGRVVLNGRPASGVQILLGKTSGGVRSEWEVRDGQYSARSGAPGEYEATLLSARSSTVIERRTLTLQEGMNYADWTADAGILRVDVRNWDRAAPVYATAKRKMTEADRKLFQTQRLTEGQASFQIGFSFWIRPEDTLPLHVVGLPFSDNYVVEALQLKPRRLVAAPVQLSLTKTQPERDIVLDLADEARTLALVDESGRPVSGARITPVPNKEATPGVYELTARPGAKILIRAAGFPLTCRVTPEDRFAQVVLRRGRPLEVHFVGTPPTTDTKVLAADSNCDVHLLAMEHVALGEAGDGITRFLFPAFPPGQSISIRWTYEGPFVRVDVPATGPLVLNSGR
jgi:hypothetical protein